LPFPGLADQGDKERAGDANTGALPNSHNCAASDFQSQDASHSGKALVAFPQNTQPGDEPLTANPQNTGSAIAMLQKALVYSRDKSIPAAERLFHLEIQIDSVLKCFASLAAQIRNYSSGKATTRAIAVRHPDGREEYVSGLALEALRLPLPNLEQDFVIYGKPDALRAVAVALAGRGWPSNGPAPLDVLAEELAAAATDRKEPDRCPMQSQA